MFLMYVVMWHNRHTINHSVVKQMLWEISNRRLLRCLITGDYTLSLMCAHNALTRTHTHTNTRAQNSPRLLIKQVILLHIPPSHSTDAAERHAWRGGRAAGSLFDSNAHESGLSARFMLQQTWSEYMCSCHASSWVQVWILQAFLQSGCLLWCLSATHLLSAEDARQKCEKSKLHLCSLSADPLLSLSRSKVSSELRSHFITSLV